MEKEEKLLNSIETLVQHEKTVLESLKKLPIAKKDFWDRFSTISTFLSSVVIALIGLYFTQSYNANESQRKAEAERQESHRRAEVENREVEVRKYQTQILEMQTIEKFVPHLTAKEEAAKKVAILTISSLGSPTLAASLAELFKSKGTQEAVDVIMASAQPKGQPEISRSVSATTTQISRSGWAYLGHHVAAERRWRTRYFDFGENELPDSLKNRHLVVRAETGKLNVRVEMPTPSGDFPRINDVVAPGRKVEIQEVREWGSSGYMWARVTYNLI